jgi:hypothetical protein
MDNGPVHSHLRQDQIHSLQHLFSSSHLSAFFHFQQQQTFISHQMRLLLLPTL